MSESNQQYQPMPQYVPQNVIQQQPGHGQPKRKSIFADARFWIGMVVGVVVGAILLFGVEYIYYKTYLESSVSTVAAGQKRSEETVVDKDNLTACKTLFGDDMQIVFDIPDQLQNISGDMTSEQQEQLVNTHKRIIDANKYAEPNLKVNLESLDEPFKAVYDAQENGGGSLNIDTSHISGDITSVMGICADAGYHADNAQ